MAFDMQQSIGTCLDTQIGKIRLVQLLGQGKSGYSFLARPANFDCIVELMHDESCP